MKSELRLKGAKKRGFKWEIPIHSKPDRFGESSQYHAQISDTQAGAHRHSGIVTVPIPMQRLMVCSVDSE